MILPLGTRIKFACSTPRQTVYWTDFDRHFKLHQETVEVEIIIHRDDGFQGLIVPSKWTYYCEEHLAPELISKWNLDFKYNDCCLKWLRSLELNGFVSQYFQPDGWACAICQEFNSWIQEPNWQDKYFCPPCRLDTRNRLLYGFEI